MIIAGTTNGYVAEELLKILGQSKGGTIAVALQAVVGRRVSLILPVGLEKRISDDIDTIASILNSPGSTGPRLLPVPGEIITEIEAISILSCAKAVLIAGGGVCGAEGAVRISVDGEPKEVETIKSIYDSIADEPPFL